VLGVGLGPGRLAQHVVAVAVALGLVLLGPLHGLADGPAHHELLAHDAHGVAHCGPYHRFPSPLDNAAEKARWLADAVVEAHDPAGQHQCPGRGIHECPLALSDMPLPVGTADLVLDQQIGRVGIGNAQQSLSQAHERDALVCGQPIFLKKLVDPAESAPIGPNAGNQLTGPGLDPPRRIGRHLGTLNQIAHHVALRRAIEGRDHPPLGVKVGGGVVGKGHGDVLCVLA